MLSRANHRLFTCYLAFFLGITGISLFYSARVSAIDVPASTFIARDSLPKSRVLDFGKAPKVPTGELSTELQKAMQMVFIDGVNHAWDNAHYAQLEIIANSNDPRLAWPITDLLRFVPNRKLSSQLTDALERLLQNDLKRFQAWHDATDHLMAWDIPAPPNYLAYKRSVFTGVMPAWKPLFVEGDVDWRVVSWGGVRIDDRPYNQTDALCNCIPAADNPPTTDAKSAKWLDDDDVVFGIHINGEARAYPRQIMEVREMVNDTLGGRHLGIPYCTLCGSAQAWFTDQLPEGVSRPILRTSGMLSRSNKVMYDLTTFSVMDTFRGQALTGPLAEKGIKLSQASVLTTSWGEWKQAYPNTTVLEERLALGRNFDFRNGRDADGPIFPIGDTDPRLAIQEDVLGVITGSGTPIAFHVPSVIKALDAGETIKVDDIEVILDGGGVRAVTTQGNDVGTHQSFWFAWSQFYPETLLWPAT